VSIKQKAKIVVVTNGRHVVKLQSCRRHAVRAPKSR
jgi:hypothetical protein